MKTRLGKSDIKVSSLGLGTNAVGGHNLYPNMLNDENGKNIVKTAIENGINMIDTAFFYGFGRSEELIGEALSEVPREKAVIATKGAQKFVGEDIILDNSPRYLNKIVDDSLKRLKTDYIDLYYIHYPDQNTPKNEAIGALSKLKEAGKIRAIGISNFTIDQLKEANKDGLVDVVQAEYNLLNREAEKDILPYCQDNNITFIPYFPLVSGLLAGKYDRNSTFNDLRSDNPHFQGEQFISNLDKIESLKDIAKRKGVEVAHLVLSWYLTIPSIDVVIPGAKNPGQVIDNLKTLDIEMTNQEKEEIDLLFK